MPKHTRLGREWFVIVLALSTVLAIGSITPLWAKELMLKIGDLQVPAGTEVHGDVIAIGGTAYVDGTVEGEAVALAGSVDVRGHVRGSVRAEGGNVVLRSTAVVDRDATAAGGRVRREPGASVGGRRATPPVVPPQPPFPGGQPLPPPWWLPGLAYGVFLMLKSLFWVAHLVLLAVFIATAWLLAVLFPNAIARLGAVLERDPVLALGAGLVGWPIAFVIAVLLVLSVVGVTLVLLVPAALFTAVQLGTTAVALLVGRRIRPAGPVQEVVIGAVILAVAFSIPGVGGLIGLAVATWGLGAVIVLLLPERRFPQPPPTAPIPPPPSPSQPSERTGTG